MTAELKKQAGPIIALDTSTAAMAAAIVNQNDVISEIQSLAERNHSVHVITHMKELLASSGLNVKEIAGIAVGNGPGSYTGMRIAVTAAKTLAWVWDKPLVGVSSLEAIACGAWHRGMDVGAGVLQKAKDGREHWVLPIMDARRGQVYSSCFQIGANEGWSRLADDGIRMMNEWVDTLIGRLEERADKGISVQTLWLVGDLSLHEEEAARLERLGTALGIEVKLMPYVLEGRWVAWLGQQLLEAGQVDHPHTFIPNYTQLTEAEVKLKAKQAGEVTA